MKRMFLAGCLLFPVLMLLMASEEKSKPSPHREGSNCRSCHLGIPAGGEGHARRTVVKDVDLVCRSCHEVKTGLSHPSGITMNWPPPDELPLDWSGRVTCTTCHYMHLDGKENKTGYMLRTETMGREFCEKCHSSMNENAGGKHRKFLDRSHLERPDSNVSLTSSLDYLSQECLGCHVGRIEQAYSPSTRRKIILFQHGQIQSTHPIAVPYPPSNTGDMKYAETADLDKRIKLYDGKIGCGTCHAPYTVEKFGLVMDNKDDQLCLQCHAMNRGKQKP